MKNINILLSEVDLPKVEKLLRPDNLLLYKSKRLD